MTSEYCRVMLAEAHRKRESAISRLEKLDEMAQVKPEIGASAYYQALFLQAMDTNAEVLKWRGEFAQARRRDLYG